VTFDYHDEQDGVLVGFYCPEYVGSSVNVPGFHFHFLSGAGCRGLTLDGSRSMQQDPAAPSIHPSACFSSQHILLAG